MACSNAFEWIVVVIIILFSTMGIVAWLYLSRRGYLSGCLGRKEKWTNVGKSLIENLLIQESQHTITQNCLDCVVSKAEKEYEPADFILKFTKADVWKECECKL